MWWGILRFLWGRDDLGWSLNFLFALLLRLGGCLGLCLGFLCCPLICFFSPSPATEFPLSLRRFKFMEKSIASISVFSVFSLFFFFVDDDDDDDGFVDDDDDVLAVLIVLVAIELVLAVVVIVDLV